LMDASLRLLALLMESELVVRSDFVLVIARF
jgi:hypothetical protein